MANYYVSKSGNDSNAGTAVGAPKLTAGSAFAAVSQGDSIIFLDSGTYSGSDNTNITARNVDDITIKADDGTSVMDLGPEEFAFFPVKGGVGLEATANTSACVLEYGYWTKS